jgi:GNAT superfamily N-acetyltransferase
MAQVNTTIAVLTVEARSLVPQTWEHTVRTVRLSESSEAGRSLAHSFAADALSQYLLDGDDMAGYSDERKWKLHVDLMTYIVAAHCYSGLVTVTGPDYDALALWMPPGKNADDWWTMVRTGMWRLYYQLSAEGRIRYYQELLPILHHTKQEVMGERDNDCYYLVYIGTKPNARGRGYASKLILDMMAKADYENRPIYLESSSPKNNAYYAKFGFEMKKDISFRRGGVPVVLYIMVREPQPLKLAYSASAIFDTADFKA